MAALAYPYEVRDSAVAAGDNRKAGLVPTVAAGRTLAAVPAVVAATTVTTVEIGSGLYVFLYDAEAGGDAAFPVDWGAALASPADRYGNLVLTRDSGRILADLDAPVSSRLAAAAGVALAAGTVAPGATAADFTLTDLNVSQTPGPGAWAGQRAFRPATGEYRTIASSTFAGAPPVVLATVGLGTGTGTAGPFASPLVSGERIDIA